ncbi:MAG: ribosome maturation factor RimM [Phormidesmis sp.]
MVLDIMTNEVSKEPLDEWLLIGKIVGAHGLNGQVKVYAESDFPERFTEAGDRWLAKPNGEPVKVRLLSGRFVDGKNQYVVKFEGIDYRDQAEDLRQARLMVPKSDRLALEPGEFHVSDLIGSTVVMQSDQSIIGTVTDVFTTGHDMLEVLLADQGTAEPVEVEEPLEAFGAIAHPSTRAKAVKKLKLQAKRKQKKKALKTLLIPFVEEIVPMVDIAAGRIEITPPPGLIDLV